jgi:hypothetical protein
VKLTLKIYYENGPSKYIMRSRTFQGSVVFHFTTFIYCVGRNVLDEIEASEGTSFFYFIFVALDAKCWMREHLSISSLSQSVRSMMVKSQWPWPCVCVVTSWGSRIGFGVVDARWAVSWLVNPIHECAVSSIMYVCMYICAYVCTSHIHTPQPVCHCLIFCKVSFTF